MDPSLEWANDLNAVIHLAISESERYGLAAMDALHISAARLLDADQFVTTEKPGKPIHRVDGMQVIQLTAVANDD
jgi:predicted nucleic acid-binding protein